MLRGVLSGGDGDWLEVPEVQVIPRAQWPLVGVSSRTVRIHCPALSRTTQRYVYRDIVEEKQRRIEAGERLNVSFVRVDGAYYLFDGHHTWAAYKMLRRQPRCVRYVGGGDMLSSPRLFSR